MGEFQNLLLCVETAGIITFSISGAMIAIEEEVDLFGVLFLGLITALGGGTLRDTLLGTLPASNFYDLQGILLSLITSLIVFLIAYIYRDYYFIHTGVIERINNVIDSIGLGLFSVYGVQVTLEAGIRTNVFLLLFMGMLTGVGGGLMRDIIVKRVPLILSKHIYAVAAIMGSACYLITIHNGMREKTAVLISVALVIVIRMLATQRKWNLPKVRRNSQKE